MQHFRPQPRSGAPRDEVRPSFCRTSTEAQGERGEECGSSTGNTKVPGVQLQPQQGAKAAHRAEGPAALQAENPGADATDTRNQPRTDDEGTRRLFASLTELLRLLSDTLPPENSR